MFSNQITGKLPMIIGQLRKLKYLDMDSIMVTGTLSTEIGKMKALETLWLKQQHAYRNHSFGSSAFKTFKWAIRLVID
jgi:hypothetical protein